MSLEKWCLEDYFPFEMASNSPTHSNLVPTFGRVNSGNSSFKCPSISSQDIAISISPHWPHTHPIQSPWLLLRSILAPSTTLGHQCGFHVHRDDAILWIATYVRRFRERFASFMSLFYFTPEHVCLDTPMR